MGYGNWTRKHSEAIKATSTIVSAIGIAFVAAGLWVSIASLKVATSALEESKKATEAQTFFNIQRFGYEVAKDTMADPVFVLYIHKGMESVPGDAQKTIVQKFSILLAAYNIR